MLVWSQMSFFWYDWIVLRQSHAIVISMAHQKSTILLMNMPTWRWKLYLDDWSPTPTDIDSQEFLPWNYQGFSMKPSTKQLRKISDRGKKTKIGAIYWPCKDERGTGGCFVGVEVERLSCSFREQLCRSLAMRRSKFGGITGTNKKHGTLCARYVACTKIYKLCNQNSSKMENG